MNIDLMTPIEYTALAGRINEYLRRLEALDIVIEPSTFLDDLRTIVSRLEGMAEQEPVLWMQSDHVDIARRSPFMARCAPTQLHPDFVPLFTRPAPQPQDASRDAYEGCREDLLDWKRRALRAEAEIRNLTQTPQPQCEPTEAQIVAVADVLLAWEAEVSDRVPARVLAEDVLRAALAAKEN